MYIIQYAEYDFISLHTQHIFLFTHRKFCNIYFSKFMKRREEAKYSSIHFRSFAHVISMKKFTSHSKGGVAQLSLRKLRRSRHRRT